MVELEDRNPAYWQALRDHLEARVTKISIDLENWARWGGAKPWVEFHFDWSPDVRKARIRRHGSQAKIYFTLGLLRWLDEVAQRMNVDIAIRSRLRVATNRGDEDLSRWMIYLWCDWIIRHEIGHFLCGHLWTGSVEWTEGDLQEGRDVQLIQAMEVDADIFAAFLQFGSLKLHLDQNIYQDFYGTTDVDEIFWDIGMLFGGLFVAFEDINPHDKVRTHPKTTERLLIFLTEGVEPYKALAGHDPSSQWTSMLRGLTTILVTLGSHDTEFGKLLTNPQPTVTVWRELLLKAGVDKCRLVQLPNDWLFRVHPGAAA